VTNRGSLDRGRPGTAAGLLWPLVRVLDRASRLQKAAIVPTRSARSCDCLYPLLKAVNLYFGTEIRGWDNVPPRGPFVIVGNHSGGAVPNDVWFLAGKWVEERGAEAPLYALAYDLLFSVPPLAPCSALGVLPASHVNARKVLKKGAAVVVFPGGDYEVFPPLERAQPHRLRWAHRIHRVGHLHGGAGSCDDDPRCASSRRSP